jgi:hypothetical protein
MIGPASAARCQTVQDFYKGTQIRPISGHPVGGDYDIETASIVTANFMHNLAPRDGTVIGSFSCNFASHALMHEPNIEADPRRFIWLGAFRCPAASAWIGTRRP